MTDLNDQKNTNILPMYEAVFTNGKEKVKPLEDVIQEIKDILDEEIDKQNNGNDKYYFNPNSFWKNQKFKELENQIKDIFGFRYVSVSPFIERYNSKTKQFKSKVMNCVVYHGDRFPIDGLITESGFYDKTHSLVMEVYISLGLLKELSAAEVLGVLLHEFGHGIDPACVTIEYVETSILSKYMTERKSEISDKHKKAMKKKHKLGMEIPFILILLAYSSMVIAAIVTTISGMFTKSSDKENVPKRGKVKKKLQEIRDLIKKDEDFNRKTSAEGYADNFARMYGYAGPLMSGIRKADIEMGKRLRSRFKKEADRRDAICEMAIACIKDVHKTDIHRIRALIKEYEEDLKDPNYSDTVKKHIREDKEELERVLDKYLNHYSALQRTINRTIYEELEKKDNGKNDDKRED